MSFRARLISFFLVIVVLPMVAMGALALRLISDSDRAQADAGASAAAVIAANVYENAEATARADADLLARDPALPTATTTTLSRLATRAGLARVVVARSGHVAEDV